MCTLPVYILLDIFEKVDELTFCALKSTSKKWIYILENKKYSTFNRISFEKYCGAFLKNGSLYMWGRNKYNVLLDHHFCYCKHMTQIKEKIHKLVLSGTRCLVITENKSLNVWGNYFGPEPIQKCKKEHIIDVCMDDHGYAAAISEKGNFYYCDSESDQFEQIKLNSNISKCFFSMPVFGCITDSGTILIANYGKDVSIPKYEHDFMLVDWRSFPFTIKTVIFWKQGICAFILTTNWELYKILIGIHGNILQSPMLVNKNVSKAIIKIDCLFFKMWDGSLHFISDVMHSDCKKRKILHYGKRIDDFDVSSQSYLLGDLSSHTQYNIFIIDDQGLRHKIKTKLN